MVTHLEQAIWAAAEPLRATRFARILRNARGSARDPSMPGPDDETQGWELSFDPAIQRPLAAATAIGLMRNSRPDMDSEWVKWTLEAKKAIARFAAKCWAGIDVQRRVVFIDEDNFQPIWGQTNLFDLRSDTPGRHLEFEGLSDPDVRMALRSIYEAARETPAYKDVMHADHELEQSREKLLLWAQLAQRAHQDLQEAMKRPTIADARERGIEIVKTTYADTPVQDIACAFQHYNRLVQQIAWSILGLAELVPSPVELTETIGTQRCTHSDDGSPLIRVTSTDDSLALLRLTHPVLLSTGTPLDGLHLVVGHTLTIAPGAASDLSLIPITASAGCWAELSEADLG